MIDFISIEVEDFHPDSLFANPQLSFSQSVNPQTGEILFDRYGKSKSVAEFGNMSIIIVSNSGNQRYRLNIRGSLHKHYKGNNFEDFNLDDLFASIDQIQNFTRIPLELCRIHQLEFGVNISPPIPTKDFIDQILSHGGKEYELRQYNETGHLKKFPRTQYELKIYDKGLQYSLPVDVLRAEIKVTKMDFLSNKGIRIVNLAELRNRPFFGMLKELLLTTLEKLIFTDDRIQPNVIDNREDRAVFKEASNPRFWSKLRESSNRMRFKRQLEKVDAIRCAHAPDDIKREFIQRVSDRWDSLSQNVTFLPLTEQAIALRSYPHIVDNNVTSSKRVCLSCGRDISGQKAGSLFCSEKTFGREAKRCRNMDSNPRNARRRKLQRLYPGYTLFPVYLHCTI